MLWIREWELHVKRPCVRDMLEIRKNKRQISLWQSEGGRGRWS